MNIENVVPNSPDSKRIAFRKGKSETYSKYRLTVFWPLHFHPNFPLLCECISALQNVSPGMGVVGSQPPWIPCLAPITLTGTLIGQFVVRAIFHIIKRGAKNERRRRSVPTQNYYESRHKKYPRSSVTHLGMEKCSFFIAQCRKMKGNIRHGPISI